MKSRATKTTGTARELADNGIGYASSGESQWTRDAARTKNIKMNGFTEGERGSGKYKGPRSLRENIRFNEADLERMRRRERGETNPHKLAKLRKNIEIKQGFLAKLKHSDADRIETLHGADEYEPWAKV